MTDPVLHLRLDGYEGPLDLLLDLARAQKLDLAGISIVALVDQYLAVIEQARGMRLELQAEWLVMAAWLAWLKSRLLLPKEEVAAEEEDPDALALRLTDRLAALEQMRAGAAWLGTLPQLGRDVFARGAPEDLTVQDRSGLRADLPALCQAYVAARRRALALRPYRPKPRRLWSVQDAIGRLGQMLGEMPSWAMLQRFLPDGAALDPVERRAALASTLIAGLELARGGGLDLRQDRAFGPILLRRAEPQAEAGDVRAA
ncbi:segregation and condensation protein A [Falsiroseomonas selenitidurans]|uniref:Segregation and condensation protein A n=1 Tax=Falsiroseomonas selenitidurans TaxID=2716335 RepID=A0ABX1EFF6_9PROT|nr:ScpA family protein [Falsiroseomonas selenitidurans]NKC34448.1 segregation/condensation protein A [Falsiroseomonas selenitidurans]